MAKGLSTFGWRFERMGVLSMNFKDYQKYDF
jgi:hypothetical protein